MAAQRIKFKKFKIIWFCIGLLMTNTLTGWLIVMIAEGRFNPVTIVALIISQICGATLAIGVMINGIRNKLIRHVLIEAQNNYTSLATQKSSSRASAFDPALNNSPWVAAINRFIDSAAQSWTKRQRAILPKIRPRMILAINTMIKT